MTARARDDSWLPALAAAVVLHVLVFAVLVLFGLPKVRMGGTAVPINIVANAPTTDSRAAEQAPQTQTAQTETPTPEAPPEATPPAQSTPAPPTPAPPRPRPTPPPPKPVPTKTVTPAPTPRPTPTPVRPAPTPKPTPTPAKPTPVAKPQPAPSFDLNKLQASIDGAVHRAQAAKPSSAPRGPSRQETAPQPRPSAGSGVSTSDVEGLGQLLNRLWNPNCAADPVDVNLTIDVDADGRIRVNSNGGEHSSDSAVAASYIRAISAVHKVEPYDPKFRGQHIPIRFNASKACANR